MAREAMEDLLRVKWYDGLLVRSDHLLHSDLRVGALFAEAARLAAGQPGLVDVAGRPDSPQQLIRAQNPVRNEESGALEVNLALLRSCWSIAPDGSLILSVPNEKNAPGVPTTGIQAQIAKSSRKSEGSLVCVTQEPAEELSINKGASQERSIELAYPGIQASVVPADQYRSHVLTDFRSSIPLACLIVDGEEVEVDPSFIPPVTRLQLVDFFVSGVLDSLSGSLQQLLDITSEYVSAGEAVHRRDVGPELLARYNRYHILNAMLLGKSGLLRDLAEISPVKFLRELMHPLATWTIQYSGDLGERGSALSTLVSSSASIRELSTQDLYVRTDPLMAFSNDLARGLCEAVMEVA